MTEARSLATEAASEQGFSTYDTKFNSRRLILVGKKLNNVKPVDSDNNSFLLNYFLNSGVFTKVS